jgi:hypothetical protein
LQLLQPLKEIGAHGGGVRQEKAPWGLGHGA